MSLDKGDGVNGEAVITTAMKWKRVPIHAAVVRCSVIAGITHKERKWGERKVDSSYLFGCSIAVVHMT